LRLPIAMTRSLRSHPRFLTMDLSSTFTTGC